MDSGSPGVVRPRMTFDRVRLGAVAAIGLMLAGATGARAKRARENPFVDGLEATAEELMADGLPAGEARWGVVVGRTPLTESQRRKRSRRNAIAAASRVRNRR